jgi:uncharacterized protein (DUF885 family)
MNVVSWMIVLFGIMIISSTAQAQTSSDRLSRFFEKEWEYRMTEFPESATYTGYPGQNHRWSDYSLDAITRHNDHNRDALARLLRIDASELDDGDRLSFELYRTRLERGLEGERFHDELMPLNQMGGVQQSLAWTVSRMPDRTVKDYEDIVARLRGADVVIRDTVVRMRRGMALGLMPPKITLRDVPDQVRNQMPAGVTASPLMQPFEDFSTDIPKKEQDRVRAEAMDALTDRVIPAYAELLAFLEDEYIPSARESIACEALPDGKDRYAYHVREITTTDLTPEEIHAIGLSEVKRIRTDMERLIKETGFDGTFEEFSSFLRTNKDFYFDSAEDLLKEYRDIAKRIDPELVKLFGTLPRLPYGVRPIPAYAEKSQTTAYYGPGSTQAGRPGYFYANTYKLETRPKWEMEALTAHEAMPGHHLQLAIAQELENLPEFRKWDSYTGFVEGWALYAESLGEDIGLYEDPYSKYGQLSYEMWRAIRLVVDTGIHHMGWSRQQAIDFFANNTGKQLHDITVEVDRYIVWPGQALSYKIGELKFKEFRNRAKETLDDAFDIREFHDVCLRNGSMPLNILETTIDDWIEKKRSMP